MKLMHNSPHLPDAGLWEQNKQIALLAKSNFLTLC